MVQSTVSGRPKNVAVVQMGDADWICGLKDRAKSKVMPWQRTCGTEESMEPLIMINNSGGWGLGGLCSREKIMNSVYPC